MNYYLTNTKETLDLLGVIRRIRTNSLKKHEMIATSALDNPLEAYQYKELYDIFIEQDRLLQEEIDAPEEPKQSIGKLLKNAAITLKDDMSSAAITGTMIIIIMSIVAVTALKLPTIAAAIIAPFICYFMFNLCLIVHLRLSRVQLVSIQLIAHICKIRGKDLLLATLIPSVALSIPWFLSSILGWKAWAFSSILFVPIIAYYAYIPVIIFDREVGFKAAMRINNCVIFRYGLELFLPLVGFLCMNIIAGPFILLTLPITMLAMMHLYDDYFTDY